MRTLTLFAALLLIAPFPSQVPSNPPGKLPPDPLSHPPVEKPKLCRTEKHHDCVEWQGSDPPRCKRYQDTTEQVCK